MREPKEIMVWDQPMPIAVLSIILKLANAPAGTMYAQYVWSWIVTLVESVPISSCRVIDAAGRTVESAE